MKEWLKIIIRKIKNNKLYDSKYSSIYDKYLVLEGKKVIRVLTPNVFRDLLYSREKEYVIEK